MPFALGNLLCFIVIFLFLGVHVVDTAWSVDRLTNHVYQSTPFQIDIQGENTQGNKGIKEQTINHGKIVNIHVSVCECAKGGKQRASTPWREESSGDGGEFVKCVCGLKYPPHWHLCIAQSQLRGSVKIAKKTQFPFATKMTRKNTIHCICPSLSRYHNPTSRQ